MMPLRLCMKRMENFGIPSASTLSGKIKKDNFNARVRNYSSARDAALSENNIPESVYDNLVEYNQ